MAQLFSHSLEREPTSPKSGGVAGLLRRLLLVVVVFAGLLMIGFVVFLSQIVRLEPKDLPRADAIIALTGGPDRIADAVSWLSEGRGRRLLISGVDAKAPLEEVIRETPSLRPWLRCCIDVDRQARNTVGNASESVRWVKRHGYRSLLIVTSSHHMPRAMVEFRRHMPDVDLIPAPVVTERLRSFDFWQDPGLLRTLGQEYGKYLVAYVRSRLTRTDPSGDMAATDPRRKV